MRIFCEREVFWVNFPGEILHWGKLPDFLYEIFFIYLILPLPTQYDFICGDVLGKCSAGSELSKRFFREILLGEFSAAATFR